MKHEIDKLKGTIVVLWILILLNGISLVRHELRIRELMSDTNRVTVYYLFWGDEIDEQVKQTGKAIN